MSLTTAYYRTRYGMFLSTWVPVCLLLSNKPTWWEAAIAAFLMCLYGEWVPRDEPHD